MFNTTTAVDRIIELASARAAAAPATLSHTVTTLLPEPGDMLEIADVRYHVHDAYLRPVTEGQRLDQYVVLVQTEEELDREVRAMLQRYGKGSPAIISGPCTDGGCAGECASLENAIAAAEQFDAQTPVAMSPNGSAIVDKPGKNTLKGRVAAAKAAAEEKARKGSDSENSAGHGVGVQ